MNCERKNVSQPKDWWAAWERAAAAKGLHLSEWIGQQCNRSLPREVRDELEPSRQAWPDRGGGAGGLAAGAVGPRTPGPSPPQSRGRGETEGEEILQAELGAGQSKPR